MRNVLDTVTMAQPLHRGDTPQAKRRGPLIEEVRNAVCEFMKDQPDVRAVKVVKLVQIDSETGSWEAEAEVSVLNSTIKALRLPVQREVLDSQVYLLRLDGQLNVVAYGLSDDVARTVKER